jgi:hypothetical protein
LKPLFKILFICLFCIGIANISYANPGLENTRQSANKTDRYIKYVYDKISFKKINKLNFEAFSKAYYGYLNLKEAGKLYGNALLTVCDFSLSSNTKRLWVIDVLRKKVLFNSLVAHGSGSGEEFANRFSNVPESHTSSLGFYQTGATYQGDNGYSLKLHGLDGAFNSNAFDRDIVIHGADYVSTSFAASNNRIGRSHGCPALPRELAEPIISKIANGSCLFIYHPNKNYLKSSFWLNNKIAKLPQEADLLDVLAPNKVEPIKWLAADTIASNATKLVKQKTATDPSRIIKLETKKEVKAEINNLTGKIIPQKIADNAVMAKPIEAPVKEYIITVDTIYTTNGKPVLLQRRKEKL